MNNHFIKHKQGHSSLNGNWIKFLDRLGVNSARLFISPVSDLRKFIGSSSWGQNLLGMSVRTQSDFQNAVALLRSSNGRDVTYPWKNPVKWNSIFSLIGLVSNPIYGSDENTVNRLIALNITVLAVLDVKCSNFNFVTLDPKTQEYWEERWELYKYRYIYLFL
jgi:hypothetical protein